jgi:hypothetical protein
VIDARTGIIDPMRTAAETEVRRPSVRLLTALLATTAAATVVVELLNYWYAPEQAWGWRYAPAGRCCAHSASWC